ALREILFPRRISRKALTLCLISKDQERVQGQRPEHRLRRLFQGTIPIQRLWIPRVVVLGELIHQQCVLQLN
ncbi:MAG: hypothetical protein ACFCU3_07570, partial [Verrucomicrobiales bacterium]